MYTLEGTKRSREFHKKEGWEDGPKDWAIDHLIELNTELLNALEDLMTEYAYYLPSEHFTKAKKVIAKAKEGK